MFSKDPKCYSLVFFFSDGPSVVKLMLKRRHLSAGKSHQIKCEAIGAKPQATISWWVGGKEVSNILGITLAKLDF